MSMNSPDKLLSGFADFIQTRRAAELHLYAGYTGGAGSLLIKVKGSDTRIAFRPWLRSRPVGLRDVLRSADRYRSFRGQEPGIHVNIAARFRDNAVHYARSNDRCALVALDRKQSAVGIIGSGILPKTVLDSFLAFCADSKLRATYDFTGTLVHEGYKRGIAQAGRIATRARNPRLFLSYSWDSDSHRRWVLRLAADLIRNGVHVLVDEWDLRDYNDDLHLFMESGIRESDFVVLVCTPEYARRANTRQGGVGVESTIITGEFYDAAKASKFVPIARKAAKGLQTCLPSYLKSRFTIDFSDDTVYQVRLEELLRRLFGQPRYRKPDLGPIPQFRSEDV